MTREGVFITEISAGSIILTNNTINVNNGEDIFNKSVNACRVVIDGNTVYFQGAAI
jgi:hypothetical protein